MKTGIVRRIDELGRIVIPREIRRMAKVKENDALEIYVQNGVICLKPYKKDCTERIEELIDEVSLDCLCGDNRIEIIELLNKVKELMEE